MSTLELLKLKNPEIKFYSVYDDEFKTYGRVINGLNTAEILAAAGKIEMPEDGSAYQASVPEFECLTIAEQIKSELFGTLPTQIGYCYGRNSMMNATEWHTSTEVNIAVGDLVLLLAHVFEIEDGKISSDRFKAFFVPRGTVIEVYQTSLHFCPCEVSSCGFGCVVALPLGTNTPLDEKPTDAFLFRKNKWIIAHEENTTLIERGVVPGIYGTNYKVNY